MGSISIKNMKSFFGNIVPIPSNMIEGFLKPRNQEPRNKQEAKKPTSKKPTTKKPTNQENKKP